MQQIAVRPDSQKWRKPFPSIFDFIHHPRMMNCQFLIIAARESVTVVRSTTVRQQAVIFYRRLFAFPPWAAFCISHSPFVADVMQSTKRNSEPSNNPDAVSVRAFLLCSRFVWVVCPPSLTSKVDDMALRPWNWHRPWSSSRWKPPVGASGSNRNLVTYDFVVVF